LYKLTGKGRSINRQREEHWAKALDGIREANMLLRAF
jgi:hypothetical protein